MWIKLISIWKASHQGSLWNRGERQLGNSLLSTRRQRITRHAFHEHGQPVISQNFTFLIFRRTALRNTSACPILVSESLLFSSRWISSFIRTVVSVMKNKREYCWHQGRQCSILSLTLFLLAAELGQGISRRTCGPWSSRAMSHIKWRNEPPVKTEIKGNWWGNRDSKETGGDRIETGEETKTAKRLARRRRQRRDW